MEIQPAVVLGVGITVALPLSVMWLVWVLRNGPPWWR